MGGAGRNLQAGAHREPVSDAFDLEGERSREDIEELSRVRVVMSHFVGARRHALLDHAERSRAHEMPAVARTTPDVVLAVVAVDGRVHCLRRVFYGLS